MINPTLEDLNRKVVHHPYSEEHGMPGIISAVNGHHVYVQFGNTPASKACRRIDLFWPEAVA